jgi:hypothetical protein
VKCVCVCVCVCVRTSCEDAADCSSSRTSPVADGVTSHAPDVIDCAGCGGQMWFGVGDGDQLVVVVVVVMVAITVVVVVASAVFGIRVGGFATCACSWGGDGSLPASHPSSRSANT